MSANYAVHFDENTGEILSVGVAAYASPEDFLVTLFPDNFKTSFYRIKIGTPLYLIERETGYAFNADAQHIAAEDIEPEETVSGRSDDPTFHLIHKGVAMGGEGTNVLISGASSGSEEPSQEEPSGSTSDEDQTIINNALSKIGTDDKVLIQVELSPEWLYRDNYSHPWAYAIANEYISPSTVVHVLGVNRDAIKTHIYWSCEEELLLFETDEAPDEKIIIYAMLQETGDEWSAHGIIEAWPGANLIAKRYRHSLHTAGDNISINGDDAEPSEGFVVPALGSANIQTPLDFSGAILLFATPEWTGHSHVIIPHFWEDASHHFCYTLTNLASNPVRISEVCIRLMYRGVIANLAEDTKDDALISGYISDEDIDELVEVET